MARLCRRGILLLALALWAGFTGAASAQDLTAPVIEHAPVAEAGSGERIEVRAGVIDDERVRQVTLYVRTAGSRHYYAIPMALQGADYRAEIPAVLTTVGALEYYIEAVDTSGNRATAPAANAASSPYAVAISSERSDDFLRIPRRRGSDLLVVVRLSEQGKIIEPDGLRILVNGRDVTREATFSKHSASFVLREQEEGARSEIQVVVLDQAGNEVSRRFSLRELPAFDASLLMKPFDGLAFNVDADAAWGPLRASVHIDSEDPLFTQEAGEPSNRFLLALDTRLLDVQVGDVTASISPLTADKYEHRGYHAHLDLGLLETTLSSGYAAHEVAGERYARKFLGARQAIDVSLAKLGINAVEVIDLEAPGIPVAPEQNYLLGFDLGFGLFGLKAEVEAATSLYFPEARGSFWEAVDDLDLPEEAEELADLAAILQGAPPSVRKYLPLPHPNHWGQNNPLVDGAVELRLASPLPWSRLEARAFRNGPDFRSLAASAAADREGYAASFTTARLLNLVRLEAVWERSRDNVQSLHRLAAGDPEPAESERNEYETADGSLSVRLGVADVKLSLGRATVNRDRSLAALAAGAPKSATETYGVELSNLRFNLGPYATNLRTGFTRTTFADAVDPANDKATTTTLLATKLTRGAYSYEVVHTLKREVDADGFTVRAPSFILGAGWHRRDVKLGPLLLRSVQIEGKSTFGQSRGNGVVKNSNSYRLRLLLEASEHAQWGAQYHSTSTFEKNTGDATRQSELTFGYLLRF